MHAQEVGHSSKWHALRFCTENSCAALADGLTLTDSCALCRNHVSSARSGALAGTHLQ
jgi:hypothetical protein